MTLCLLRQAASDAPMERAESVALQARKALAACRRHVRERHDNALAATAAGMNLLDGAILHTHDRVGAFLHLEIVDDVLDTAHRSNRRQ